MLPFLLTPPQRRWRRKRHRHLQVFANSNGPSNFCSSLAWGSQDCPHGCRPISGLASEQHVCSRSDLDYLLNDASFKVSCLRVYSVVLAFPAPACSWYDCPACPVGISTRESLSHALFFLLLPICYIVPVQNAVPPIWHLPRCASWHCVGWWLYGHWILKRKYAVHA